MSFPLVKTATEQGKSYETLWMNELLMVDLYTLVDIGVSKGDMKSPKAPILREAIDKMARLALHKTAHLSALPREPGSDRARTGRKAPQRTP